MTPKSFLQTSEWLDFQKYVGRKTWRFDDGKIQANIIRHDLPMGKNYLYIPQGPVIFFDSIHGGLKNEVASFTNYIKELGQQNKSIFIKVEPLSDMAMELIYRRGFRRSFKNIQPQKTIILDLNLPEDELLGKMHQKTRYNINLASKKGLNFKESENLDIFWELLKKTAQKDNFSTHSKDYYKKLLSRFSSNHSDLNGKSRILDFVSQEETKSGEFFVKMFLAYHEDKPIAGAIVMVYANTAYYLHGAMDRNYANMMAPHFMHWEIIKWAKGNNLEHYDLWGIDAKKWPGVTRFKLGWGGREVEYPGSFDLPVSRLWYFVYNLARKIF